MSYSKTTCQNREKERAQADAPTFAIKVFGCQMNVYDGDRLRNAMTALGWSETEAPEDADFAIYITCSIRDKAEQKVVSELGRFRPLWERGRRPKIALLGCMAQRTGRGILKRFPWVRVAAGPRSLGAVPGAIAASHSDGSVRIHLDDDPRSLDDLSCIPSLAANRHKAYVTIAHGCDQFCSYCIVPYVRGRFGSRRPEDILSEMEALAERGVLEITLIGQNVNTYGRDFTGEERYPFARLLREAAEIKKLRRIRFTTSRPIDFTDDILEAMAARSDVICPSVNLPVQAGSDKVLKEMNRKYTRAEYLDTVMKIRRALPEVGLTSDLIVGFPGETEEEFEESASLLEEVRFDLVHTAAYSPREGTPAASRTDQVPREERSRRLLRINRLQEEISREINSALVGSRCGVLIDEPFAKGGALLQGRTETDKVVLISAPPELIGEYRDVLITGSNSWCLEGELL